MDFFNQESNVAIPVDEHLITVLTAICAINREDDEALYRILHDAPSITRAFLVALALIDEFGAALTGGCEQWLTQVRQLLTEAQIEISKDQG